MEFPDFLAGYVRIQVSGDACERFFNLCAYHRLKLWRLLPEAEAYTACISVRDFRKLKTLVKKATSDCVSQNGTGFLFLSGNIAGGGFGYSAFWQRSGFYSGWGTGTCMENYSEWKCAADFSGSV